MAAASEPSPTTESTMPAGTRHAGGTAPAGSACSRAVLRPIEAGSYVNCVSCGERVKFQAKVRLQQVICNVYLDGRWLRVEHYHEACYTAAEDPYGVPA